MALDVRIERARCIGSKTCVHRLPQVFQLDSSGIAIVIDASRGTDEELLDAAEDCPTGAIEIFRDGERLV